MAPGSRLVHYTIDQPKTDPEWRIIAWTATDVPGGIDGGIPTVKVLQPWPGKAGQRPESGSGMIRRSG